MKLYFAFLIALFPLLSYSQSNYREGYVLKNNGDTLKGYVNFREWAKTPLNIQFKSKKAADIEVFTPADIRGFGVSPGVDFVTYTGSLSNTKTQFPNIDDHLDTTSTHGMFFLKRLIAGDKASLFVYTNTYKSCFLISEQGIQPVELKFYYYYSNVLKIANKGNIYTGQLKALFEKYNLATKENLDKIDRSAFDENNLMALFKVLNGITKKQQNSTGFGSRWFAGAGLNYNKTFFTGDNRFADGKPDRSYSPEISIGIDNFTNKIVQRFVFRAELSFGYNKPSISVRYATIEQPVTDTYSFEQYNFKLTPQFMYNIYNADALKVYLNAGASVVYSLYGKNELLKDGTVDPKNAPYKLEKVWFCFPLRAGLVINKQYDVGVAYITPSPYEHYIPFSIKTNTWNIGVKYLFKTN
jgi:hypothetical protein